VQNPEGLSTFGRRLRQYHKYFKNKHLTPARDGQIAPADCDQGHWLFHANTDLL